MTTKANYQHENQNYKTTKNTSLNSYQETCMAHNCQKALLSARHAGYLKQTASNGRKEEPAYA